MAHVERSSAKHADTLTRQLDAIAWALFFVWAGVALLADVGWGVGILGVGIIALGTQLARLRFGLGIEVFWVVVGLLLVLGGVWEMLSVRISMLPFVLIGAGIILLVSVARRLRTDTREERPVV